VNDVDILAGQLEADPCNTIVRAMLTDALMEDRDMPPTEAERHVRDLIKVATWRREYELVSELWRCCPMDRRRMLAQVFEQLPSVSTPYCGPYLICGDVAPYATVRDWHGDGEHYSYFEVAVGTSWLYAQFTTTTRADAEQRLKDKAKSKRRRRR